MFLKSKFAFSNNKVCRNVYAFIINVETYLNKNVLINQTCHDAV